MVRSGAGIARSLLLGLASLVFWVGCKDESTLRSLKVQRAGEGSGSVATNDGSLSCHLTPAAATPCAQSYESDQNLILTATPDPGATFAGWSGACEGLGDCQLNLSRDRLITATFDVGNFRITVLGQGTGTGTVTSEPGPTPTIACTVTIGATAGACEGTYLAATVLRLNATPATGSDFSGWSGACTGTGACEVKVIQRDSVRAVFTLKSFSLTVLPNGGGTGTVQSQAGLTPAIACTPGGPAQGCTASYPYGTQVQLTASAGNGSIFGGWGNSCGTAATCAITVQSDTSVSAQFNLQTFQVSVTGAGTGGGVVTTTAGISPAISCTITGTTATGSCQQSYSGGTQVSLQAAPSNGSQFAGWSGACTGAGACVVTTTGTVTATFNLQPVTLTVTGSGSGAGTVASQQGLNPVISCTITGNATSGSCSQSYSPNTAVTLTAQASAGATFAGWSGGGCSGTAPCPLTLNQSTTVTATFGSNQGLTVVPAGDGDGNVQSQNGLNPAINCLILNGSPTAGAACSQTYSAGTMVTLTATANTGTTFSGWSLAACTGTGPCSVTTGQVSTVTATFTKQSFALTVTGTGSGGSGTVAAPSATPALSCTITSGTAGAGCQQTYKYGTQVALTATAGAGSSFGAWTLPAGQGPCPTVNCAVTVTQALTVTAGFTANTPQLTVTLAGTGSGTVAIPAGTGPAITCGPGGTPSPCSASFAFNAPVTLTAQATTGSTFSGWSGEGCSGTGTCAVTMSEARNVTATFTLQKFNVTVVLSGSGTGTVSSQAGLSPAISCSTNGNPGCTGSYDFGTSVALTGTPTGGSLFITWSGSGCSGFGTCVFQVSQARSVTAQFDLPAPTTLAPYGIITYNAAAGTAVSQPPAVIVRDQRGRPMSGQSVHFSLGGGGSITPNPADIPTQASGVAALGGWTVGTSQGAGVVQASLNALNPITFNANGTAPPGLIQVAANAVTLKTRPFSSSTDVREIAVRNGVPGTITVTASAQVTQQPTNGSGAVVVQFAGFGQGQAVSISESNATALLIQTSGSGTQNGGDFFLGRVILTPTEAGVKPDTITFRHNFDANPVLGARPYQLVFHSTAGAAAPGAVLADILNLNLANDPVADTLHDVTITQISDLQGNPAGWLQAALLDSIVDDFNPNLWHHNTPNRVRVGVSAQPVGTSSGRIITTTPDCFCANTLFVQYTVDPTPTIELSGTALAFTLLAGDAPPPVVPITVRNLGVGSLTGLTATPSASQTWLQATVGAVANPTATLNLILVNTAGLAAGVHTANVVVASNIQGVASRTITVTLTVLQ